MKFILDYRALFQANNDIHTLGDSKTGYMRTTSGLREEIITNNRYLTGQSPTVTGNNVYHIKVEPTSRHDVCTYARKRVMRSHTCALMRVSGDVHLHAQKARPLLEDRLVYNAT